jgi:hypothetical protein
MKNAGVGCLVVGLVVLLIFGAMIYLGSGNENNGPSQGAAISEFKAAIAEVRLHALGDVEVDNRTTENSFTASLYYRAGQNVSLVAARVDMEAIARSLLSRLVSEGHHPSKDRIYISIFASERTSGETGVKLFFDLGYVYYDCNDDQLKYHPKIT